jgi:hypothetical protein
MRFFNAAGVLQKARRSASLSDNVQDEQVKDPVKLGEILRGIMRRVSAVEAVVPPEPIEFEVTVGAGGALTRLTHNFGQNARYIVTDWRPTAVSYAPRERPNSTLTRAYCVGTWTTAVGNNTVGGVFRLMSNKPIIGVRFGWNITGRTVKCSLWRNDTGAQLATVNVATTIRGIYEGYFSTPITTDLTGTDITVGAFNATDQTYNNDAVWAAFVPYYVNSDLKVVGQSMYLAGDNRPTTVGAGFYYMVEPILAETANAPAPALSVDSSTTTNVLVLKSYVAGKAVIRVEPTQNGASL